MWREDFDYLENIPGKPGSSTAMLIEYLETYLRHPKIVQMAEEEFRLLWYSQKKKEIELWYSFKNGWKEGIEREKKWVEKAKQKEKELEEALFRTKLLSQRRKIEKKLKWLRKEIQKKEMKISKWEKQLEAFEKWVPGTKRNYKKTLWWKKGYAKEYPSRDRLIQKAIEEFWRE